MSVSPTQKFPILFLAPMEGVIDAITRDILTRIGGIDFCLTEFIRVTNQLVPKKVYLRHAPELLTGSRTTSGCPVIVQLLGGDPVCLAENAAFAVELGAIGIDLNFGCPAKLVNRHDGGAKLLLHPDRIFSIVETVRKTVPAHVPVTAKIRLGFTDPNTCLVNAEAVAAGGANHVVVHCRTKMDMYKPPAYWEWIPKIRERVKIPIVANGEIWNLDDLERCRAVTGCDHFMIGRGVFRDPFVFLRAKSLRAPSGWKPQLDILVDFFQLNWSQVSPWYAQARLKQWLRSLAEVSVEGRVLFDQLKAIHEPNLFRDLLLRSCGELEMEFCVSQAL